MSEPPKKKQKLRYNKNFHKSNRKRFLEVGHKGFLATCNFDEKHCIRECYDILNQYANKMYGIEELEKPNDEDGKVIQQSESDISDELQNQINATHATAKKTNRRFQVVCTGSTNCVFIKSTLSENKTIVEKIVNDIIETKQPKTRHLFRLLPIYVVCKANMKDIVNAAGQLCDEFFLKDHTTFSIVFNKRLNTDINRDSLIHELADLIQTKNVENKVDLKHPKRSLIVEVIKGLCCLTVLDDYILKKRYNLFELSKNYEEQIMKKDGSGISDT